MQITNFSMPSGMMSSKRIAAKTGKEHFNVIRDIRKMLEELESGEQSNLIAGEYEVFLLPNNSTSEILLNERLCICLASGYSVVLRMAIIDDWATMKRSSMPALPQNYAEALRALAAEVEEKEIIQLQLAEAKPKVEFYDAVTDSTDAVDLGTAAKVLNLGFGRTTLFEKLRDNKILMKNNQPFQKYIDAGWFRVIETSWTHPNGDTHVNFKTVVYQKGLDGIRKLLSTENF